MTHLSLHRAVPLRRLGAPLLLTSLLVLPALTSARAPVLPDAALKQAIDACNKDPAYRLGGAATGDCLELRSGDVDIRIDKQLKALASDHCPAIAAALHAQQAVWQAHRQAQCAIYRQLFDNTAMYINATVCTLRMGLQRAHELDQLVAFQPGQPLACEHQPDKAPPP